MWLKYRISRNIDSDFNLVIWRMHQDRQINLCHYRSIYTTSMSFSPHRTEIRQFKILPTAFSEQTAKCNVRQYFCLYGKCDTDGWGNRKQMLADLSWCW